MITVTCKDFNELKEFAREILGITDEPKQGVAPAMKNPEPEKPAPKPEPVAETEDTGESLVSEKESIGKEKEATKPEKEPETITCKMEDVRAKLAVLNKAGKRDVVAKLLQECGASKLSDVDPSKYGWLMEKAGEA